MTTIPVGTGFITNPVLNGAEPILEVQHYDDGTWGFVGVSDIDINDSSVIHADHMFLDHPDIMELLDLPLGYYADRDAVDEPWIWRKI